MKDTDEVVEQPVGTERCLLVERTQFDIAAIDIFIAECLELVVAMMLAAQFVVGNIMIAAITEDPYVGLTSFLQDILERQGHGTAMLIGSPRVVASCILDHLTDGALATRNIPDAARDIVEQDGGTVLLCYQRLQLIVVFIDGIEETIGLLFATEEQAIETQPLGPA